MSSRQPSARPGRAAQAGFTLIELMVGVLIGLLATLAVTHVLVNSEGQKRTTTSGSDAQINGALALAQLQRTIRSAGYGFAATPSIVGCNLEANHADAASLPKQLVPVEIIQTAGEPDQIRVFSSGKKTFSIPLRVVVPGYNKDAPALMPLSSIRGIEEGDLLIAASAGAAACEMFRVTGIASATSISKQDAAWTGPDNNYSDGSMVINMGAPVDVTYMVDPEAASLRSRSMHVDKDGNPSWDAAPVELFPNIVNLRALYGVDSDGDGAIDAWNNTKPATNADWLKVLAIRVALVARSAQFEKEEVTLGELSWDVGDAVPVDGSADCGAGSKCLELKVSSGAGTEWKHYRYRIYDTVIPLRNMLWNS